MLVYVHPVLGAAALALLLYAAWQGIGARGRPRNRARKLAAHSAIAPWAFAAVLLTWVAGGLSTHFLRGDIDFAETNHFGLGSTLVTLLGLSLVSSRRMLRGSVNAREVHVWIGVAAVLVAAAQAFTGLRITP